MTPQQSADLTFMALVVWRESRGESLVAKIAVAYTVLDRVAKPTWWGHDVMSVIFKKWQYSSMTAPHDPQLTAWPVTGDQAWLDSLQAAGEAIAGSTPNPAPSADSYFDVSIPAPAWATPAMFVKAIGRLRFYNVNMDTEAAALGLVVTV
jgi:N-acetylmuramoyl-L-alanine amidase